MAESEFSPEVEAQAQTRTVEPDAFASLLHKEFKPRTDRAKEAVEQAVHTLAEQALSHSRRRRSSPRMRCVQSRR